MYLMFRCGVLWSEGQFTLDCRECGGFSADRPCVDCDGQCGQVWQRDVPTVSEQKAFWTFFPSHLSLKQICFVVRDMMI